ncbi:MAG: tryptophan--tRNA ligase [Pelagibacterales bacterium]|nr:tryptophan--tRNA ligase [Pelagibacterales bacterium]
MSENNIVLSGVQPTGNLHLGNYLGAIKNFVSMQKDYECLFCVVDLHAITVFQDPKELKNNTYEIVASYLASGINQDKSVIFNQSQVSCHAELAWVLSCVCRIGWLNRMTQFKEKAGKDKEKASAGLYTYPILMASDILLYKATHVPVGNDQKQHLELTRDIAQKFNNDFDVDNFFPLPEPFIDRDISRVMSLRDGMSKMSKSDISDYSRINLQDDKDLIIKKIKKSKTADTLMPSSLDEVKKFPEINNLLNIFTGVTDKNKNELINFYKGLNFSGFKSDLADAIVDKISPIGNEIRRLMDDKKYLDNVLSIGNEKAKLKASKTMSEIYDIIGFINT